MLACAHLWPLADCPLPCPSPFLIGKLHCVFVTRFNHSTTQRSKCVKVVLVANPSNLSATPPNPQNKLQSLL